MKTLATIINENISTDGRSTRLFHGRGKMFPTFEHVSIDYFSTTVLITLYKEATSEMMTTILESLMSVQASNILVQKRYLPRPTIEAVKGDIPTDEMAVEDSLKYQLKFSESQNIGFFLDMYPGRKLLRQISSGKKILNLFSYTCSISVAAIKGGASDVTNIDMSKAALAVGEGNHLNNGKNLEQKVRFLAYDIMKSWNKIFKYGPYDIVIIDPPTNQGDSFKVDRDYYKIVKRLKEMTEDHAVVLACLNSPHLTSQFLIDLFSEHAPEFEIQEIIYSGFSSMEKNPEEGLKIVVFKKVAH
jgi:23S rRNA (cytosine1962-C5)-methyltransferase